MTYGPARPTIGAVGRDGHALGRGEPAGDDTVDGCHGGSFADAGSDCFDELRSGEGGVVLGERAAKIGDPVLRRDGPVDDGAAVGVLSSEAPHVVVAHGQASGGRQERLSLRRTPSGVDGLDLPCGVVSLALDLRFASPGGQNGGLSANGTVRGPGGVQPGIDLGGSLGEHVAQVLGDAGYLGYVAAGIVPE